MKCSQLTWNNHEQLNKYFSFLKLPIPWSSLTLLAWKYYKINIYFLHQTINDLPVIFLFAQFQEKNNSNPTPTPLQQAIKYPNILPFFPLTDQDLSWDIIKSNLKSIYQSFDATIPNLILCCPENKQSIIPKDPTLEPSSFNSNYIYNSSQFHTFSGKKLQKKRNHLNYFLNNHSATTEASIVTSLDLPNILNFAKTFPQSSDHSDSLNYELEFMTDFFTNWDHEKMHGILIKDKTTNNIITFSIGLHKNPTTFEVFFEKAQYEYRGIIPYMIQQISKSLPENIIYLDRQDDLKQANIEKAKLAFIPAKVTRLLTFFWI